MTELEIHEKRLRFDGMGWDGMTLAIGPLDDEFIAITTDPCGERRTKRLLHWRAPRIGPNLYYLEEKPDSTFARFEDERSKVGYI
ncbi:hypothetical protein EYZ11_001211 [Aspergillus tanneri]|uniref:Uncharacterized protein n=1 Tax=Aspergillus tanneri TaxID=1220188 RepID=A0A4S3JV76_9EURO|nr:hypothetical protein EYZ11_001211 [Aspergillus tanneri]